MRQPRKDLSILLDSLHKIKPLSKALEQAVEEGFEEINLDKKVHLLRCGEVCDCFWFLADGIIRSVVHYQEKANETTTRIMLPGHIVVSVLSYYKGIPSTEEIITVTPCTVFKITKATLNKILDEYIEFERHVRILTEDYACQISQRVEMLRQPTPICRYKYNLKHFKEFAELIPVEYAASFTNMDRTTYTNIRSGKYPKRKN